MMRRLALGFLGALLLVAAVSAQRQPPNFAGTWKLESMEPDTKFDATLVLKVDGEKVEGTLKTTFGEFILEKGSVDGADVFFNVIISRDGYDLKTSYRGHFYNDEVEYRVEAGERSLHLLARRPAS